MTLDHGMLNVQLAKRGNIDAQIDRYLGDQAKVAARARKAASKLRAEQRVEAKKLIAGMSVVRINNMAKKLDIRPSAVRQMLKSMAYFDPAKLIASEAAAAAQGAQQ